MNHRYPLKALAKLFLAALGLTALMLVLWWPLAPDPIPVYTIEPMLDKTEWRLLVPDPIPVQLPTRSPKKINISQEGPPADKTERKK
jgi:hypothetical protein